MELLMKCFTAWVLIICVTGCTTMRPIDGSPTELRQLISSGELLKPGERVRIVTADDKAHRFAITKVEAGLIAGPKESIPVDRVMYLEKREFQRIESPMSFPFDTKAAVASLLAIAVLTLKPNGFNATP
jgi:hypothetical protein